MRVSGESGWCVVFFVVELLLSCREEFSMVKRAGNSCSPVRGSFLADDMLDVVDMRGESLVVCECVRQYIGGDCLLAIRSGTAWEERKILFAYLTVAIPSAARQLSIFDCRGAY